LDHYWNYEGSFTTPPCTEAVTFYIMMDKAPISQAQLDKFKLAIGWEGAAGNFRPPQPLEGRTVAGCMSVATPVITGDGPKVKTKKCADQTPTIVIEAVIACIVVILLAAVLCGAFVGIFSPSDASAREVHPKGMAGSMATLQEDIKLLEMELSSMQERDTISKNELAQLMQLLQRINEETSPSQGNGKPGFLQTSSFMKAREQSRRSQTSSIGNQHGGLGCAC